MRTNQLIANLIKRARRISLCHFEMILDLPNTIHLAHGFLRNLFQVEAIDRTSKDDDVVRGFKRT